MDSSELKELLLLANRFKEGDLLVGGTRDEQVSRDARRQISAINIGLLNGNALVEDRVTEALHRSLSPRVAGELSNTTVAEVKRALLGDGAQGWIDAHRFGLSSEAVAAVVKIMSDDELCSVSSRIFNPLSASRVETSSGVAIGSAGHFGSRIQPNSPGDDEEEILFSILEGLSYGCG